MTPVKARESKLIGGCSRCVGYTRRTSGVGGDGELAAHTRTSSGACRTPSRVDRLRSDTAASWRNDGFTKSCRTGAPRAGVAGGDRLQPGVGRGATHMIRTSLGRPLTSTRPFVEVCARIDVAAHLPEGLNPGGGPAPAPPLSVEWYDHPGAVPGRR